MRKVYVLRSLPGAGKSYLANELVKKHLEESQLALCHIFSTDSYFVRPDGYYDFNPKLLSQAHTWNFSSFVKHMIGSNHILIVDNTNTQFWEMENYIDKAIENGYNVEIQEPHTAWAFDINELEKKNTHGVPRKSLERMLDRWQYTHQIYNILKEKYPNITVTMSSFGGIKNVKVRSGVITIECN